MSQRATIFVVDCEEDFLAWSQRHLAADGVEIQGFSDPVAALKAVEAATPDLVLLELRLRQTNGLDVLRRIRQHDPDATVIMTTGFPPTSAVIEAMKLGAYDFLRKEGLTYELRPVVEAALQARDALKSAAERASRPGKLSQDDYRETIIGKSAAMQEVFKMIGRVSRSEAPVLITGESGCGKEIVANAIHQFSMRAKQEYVAINCAAIPGDLLESELFGHEKGAFTGATTQRIGRFEQCDGGTLFLDEIGDMPLPVQSKILRVLQEGEFSRVGGNQTLKSDVRILAATNRDLETEVEENRFREDLFYRLNVVRIHIPPLRDRREDIPLLVEFFLQRAAAQRNAGKIEVTDEALALLETYDWPGNVRELENTLQRACVLASKNVLLPRDIPLGRVPRRSDGFSRASDPNPVEAAAAPAAKAETEPPNALVEPAKAEEPPGKSSNGIHSVDAAVEVLLQAAEKDPEMQLLPWLEQQMTHHAMKRVGGNQVQAARLLGITRGTLRKRLERYGIS